MQRNNDGAACKTAGGYAARVIALLVLCTAPLAMAEEVQLPDSFERAKSIAHAHQTLIGPRAMRAGLLAHGFQQWYLEGLQQCVARYPDPDRRPFVLIAALDAEGRVRRVYGHPKTRIQQCAARRLQNWVFPKPSFAPLFVGIPTDVRQQSNNGG